LNEIPNEYKILFVDEALDYLSRLEEIFLSLEHQRREDFKESINEAMRLLHTIKGSAGMVGAEHISAFAHKMEDFLISIYEGKLELSSNVIDVVLEAIDKLRNAIDAFSRNEKIELDHSIFNNVAKSNKDAISKILEKYMIDKEKLLSFLGKDHRLFEITVVLDEACNIKKIRAFLILKLLSEVGKVISTSPTDISSLKENFFSILLSSNESINTITAELNKMPDIKSINIEEVKVTLDRSILKTNVGEKVESILENLLQKIESSIDEKKSAHLRSSSSLKYKIEEVKVRVNDLDKLFNLVGELLLLKSRLNRLSRLYDIHELKESISKLGRLVLDISEVVMRMRLIPLEQIFSLLPRMVRDLSKKAGKEVDLIIEGREIRVDRRILEEILDPLIHLVRNAIDHGIEPPKDRIAKGKIPKGTLKVSARKEGNYIVIEVEDDGKGIDPNIIREVAIKKGIISRNIASRLSDREILNLIFTPGFSTKEKVTSISGRGIGMSTVKSKVEELGGSVELWSKVNQGTRITLRLPLQVATLKVMIVRIEDNLFAIPISNVVRVIRVSNNSLIRIKNEILIDVNNKLIPVVSLSGISKVSPYDTIIIVTDSRRSIQVGLSVSSVLDQEDVVVKPLSSLLKGIRWLSGVAILGDGSLCLIVDVDMLIKERVNDVVTKNY